MLSQQTSETICIIPHFSFSGNGTNMSATDDLDAYWDDYLNGWGADLPEKAAADIIYVYVSPFLLFFGTVGNILSLVVLSKLSREVFSTCIYLAVLAVVDLLVLYTRCGNDWLRQVASLDLSNMLMVYSESICKVYPFVFNFLFHLSKWLIVAMAVEGFIATKYPHKVPTMCTLSRAQAVILLLTVLLVCVNIHYFWSFELVQIQDIAQPHGFFCTFSKHGHQYSEGFQEVIWPIMDLLVSEVLPYTVVIVSGVTMMTRMAKGQHKGDKKHQEWRARYLINPDAMDQLKLTFLIVCLLYLVLTLPKFAYVIFQYLVDKHELIEYSFEFDAQQVLAHAICTMLEYMFFSMKFFIYFATSMKFRLELKALFKCNKHSRHKVHNPDSIKRRPLMRKEEPTTETADSKDWKEYKESCVDSPFLLQGDRAGGV